MILIDTNLLVYASNVRAPEHQAAHAWLEEQLSGATPIALPWASLLGFIRLITNPRIMPKPLPVHVALDEVDRWLSAPSVWTPSPTPRHAAILRDLLVPGASANLVPDAHLAALAIEHGLTLCSTDRDFGGFPKLKWLNPLRQ